MVTLNIQLLCYRCYLGRLRVLVKQGRCPLKLVSLHFKSHSLTFTNCVVLSRLFKLP